MQSQNPKTPKPQNPANDSDKYVYQKIEHLPGDSDYF